MNNKEHSENTENSPKDNILKEMLVCFGIGCTIAAAILLAAYLTLF